MFAGCAGNTCGSTKDSWFGELAGTTFGHLVAKLLRNQQSVGFNEDINQQSWGFDRIWCSGNEVDGHFSPSRIYVITGNGGVLVVNPTSPETIFVAG